MHIRQPLTLTAALVLGLSTPLMAMAQAATEAPAADSTLETDTTLMNVDPVSMEADPQSSWVSSRAIEGADVFSLAETYDQGFWDNGGTFDTLAAEWEEIGEVEEVIIGRDGTIVGVTVEVGGFLGIGERRVLLGLDDIRLTQQAGDDDLIIVTRLNRESLEDREDIGDLFGDD